MDKIGTRKLFPVSASVLPLFLLIMLLWALSAPRVNAQAQGTGPFKEFDGGFEGQATYASQGSTTSLAGNTTNAAWTIGSATGGTEAIVSNAAQARTGSKYAQFGYTSTSSKRFQSPTAGDAAVASATSYVIQFWYRTAGSTAPTNLQGGVNPYGTSGTPGPTYGNVSPMTATSGAWQKTSVVLTSTTSTASPRYGIGMIRASNTLTVDIDIDDFVMYPGTELDITAPADPGATITVSGATPSSLNLSWAASSDVDLGGYMVVRGTADPSTAPNGNGIYGKGNSLGSGTVVYVGTGTSFTDNYSMGAATTYYYRVYAVDKAFNYSTNYGSGSGSTEGGTSTITAGSGTEPSSVSSLLNAQIDAVLNFDFTVTDDGGTPATDASPFQISQIVVNQGTGNDIADWTTIIQGALLNDGTNDLTANVTIGATSITFASIANATAGDFGYIADDGNKTYTLKVWLKNALNSTLQSSVDGSNLVFLLNNSSFTLGGGSSLLASSQSLNSGAGNNAIDVTATKLIFTSYKPDASVVNGLEFPVEVQATDANNNRDLGNTASVTLSLATGTGSLTSAAGLTQNLAAGIYSWNDILYNTIETFTITASDGVAGLTDITSGAIACVNTFLIEDFDYTTGTDLKTANTSWVGVGTDAVNNINVSASGLTFTGYPGSGIGKAADLIGATSSDDDQIGFTQIHNGSVYYSFLVNVTSNGSTDGHFTGLKASLDGAFTLRLFCGNSSSPFKFGLGTGAGTYAVTPTTVASGTTALLVMKYTVGGNAKLYVFPDGNTIPNTEPVTPEVELSGITSFNPRGVYLRQDATSITGQVDGIRTSQNWINSPLPVELTSFTGMVKGRQVILTWKTATEVGNYGFSVERLLPGGSWKAVAFINGSGNSNSEKTYSYRDNLLNERGELRYRLKQIDNDGSFTYTGVVAVNVNNMPVEFSLTQNYPNPFNPATRIEYAVPAAGVITLEVFNVLGNRVAVLAQGRQEAGYHVAEFNAAGLATGVYYARLTAGNTVLSKKMMLLR